MVAAFRFEASVGSPAPAFDAGLASDAARRVLADASGVAGFLEVPGDLDALARVQTVVRGVPERFTKVLVLGIGGSGLGAEAALQALAPCAKAPGAREVRILANVDPVTVARSLAWFDPADTLLVVVTKSGTTVETLSQFALFADRIRRERGEGSLADGVVMVTDPEKGAVRRLAKRLGCAALDVPPRVGGRFSVLTPVGLLPVALAGHDPAKLLEGARQVVDSLHADPSPGHPSVASAAAQHSMMAAGRGVRVLWAYCDRLSAFGDWFCQLWAESLGKPKDGAAVGQTPVRAVGSTDQHSLLQLFMEGPQDKHVTFLTVGGAPSLRVPDLSDLDPELAEFANKDLGEIFEALRSGTMAGLVQAGRPVARIHVPSLDEVAVGALFAHFEVETAVAGHLLGIDPFDQPGVEAGKKFAHGLLGRPGMEGFAAEARRLLGGGR